MQEEEVKPMNPFLGAVIYSLLHSRSICNRCGMNGHHRRIKPDRFLCNSCGKEFTPVKKPE